MVKERRLPVGKHRDFRTMAEAIAFAKKLRKKGFKPKITTVGVK